MRRWSCGQGMDGRKPKKNNDVVKRQFDYHFKNSFGSSRFGIILLAYGI